MIEIAESKTCFLNSTCLSIMYSRNATSQGAKHALANILTELGLITIWQSSLDVKLLCAQRFVRLFAYGGSTLILASYLSALGITDDRIGLFMTLTLVGDVVISFFLTLFADAMGRRAVLALGSALMVGSGVVFAAFGNFWILLGAAILGVISPRCVFSATRLLGCLLKYPQRKRNWTFPCRRGIDACRSHAARTARRCLRVVFSLRECWHGCWDDGLWMGY